MLVDAKHWRDGTEIRADLCIVGSGAAGVTLAHSLRDTHLSIAVFESGGLETEPATQARHCEIGARGRAVSIGVSLGRHSVSVGPP